MTMTNDEVAEVVEGVIKGLRESIVDDMKKWVLVQQKDKLERVLDLNCEDDAQRRAMRETVKFGHKSREWIESPEGKAALESLGKLAKLLGTPEGAEKIRTLESLAESLNETDRWIKSKIWKAAVVGLVMLAFIGVQSWDSIKRLATSIIDMAN